MRTNKLILALVASLALASAACAKLQARDNLNKGVRAFRDSKYEVAVNYFKEAIRLDPSLTNAELYLATAYSQQFIPGAQSEENQRNAELAIETFEKVLQRDAGNVNAIAGLASIYQNTSQFEKAREFYIQQAELDPQNPTPFYAVGTVNWTMVFNKVNPLPPEEQLKLIEEGFQYLDKALTLNPDYEDAMTYKNLLYRLKADRAANEEEKQKLIALADEWFNKALETRKRNAEKKALLGQK
jgi:tetratricopeptide (TPR) repeat protein